jgi:hypothetical protein
VSAIDVYMNDVSVARWSCTDGGATITYVPFAQHLVTVEGVDSSNVIRLRHEFNVSPYECGDTLVTAQPAEGTVGFGYAFSSGGTCMAGSRIDVWVDDWTLGYRGVNGLTSWSLPCGDPIDVWLPEGDYTLVGVEEVTGGAVTASWCGSTDFSVVGGRSGSLPSVILADGAGQCPFSPPATRTRSKGPATTLP